MAARGRRSGFILIVLALIIILGVAAAFLLMQRGMLLPGVVQAQPQEAVPQQAAVEMVNIVVTTQNIPRGVEFTADVLTTVPYPKTELVEGMFFTSIEDVVGKRAKEKVEARTPLTSAIVLEDENPMAGYASFDIPANFTAVSMPINKLTSVSFGTQPGDHVMVIGCMMLVDIDPDFQSKLPNNVVPVNIPGQVGENGPITGTITIDNQLKESKGRAEMDNSLGMPVYVIPAGEQRPRLVCQTMVQDAVVLGVGEFEKPEETPQEPVDPAQQAAAQPVAEGQQPAPEEPDDDIITLVVSPQDAVAINYMMLAKVKLTLALRNPTDTSPFVTEAVTQQYLMDQKAIPLPAKLPYGMEPAVSNLCFPWDTDSSCNQAPAVQQ